MQSKHMIIGVHVTERLKNAVAVQTMLFDH
jgi:hypothetical protein